VVKVVVDRAGHALYFSRSAVPHVRGDGVKPLFLRHQGIYGYSVKFLLQFVRWRPSMLEKAEQLEQLRALENGAKIRVLVTKTTSVGVDSPADVAGAERLLAGK
jgi:3-deoxy-manno-octulosonate cytidylyltransferase (CMP-KDO synthetase)